MENLNKSPSDWGAAAGLQPINRQHTYQLAKTMHNGIAPDILCYLVNLGVYMFINLLLNFNPKFQFFWLVVAHLTIRATF